MKPIFFILLSATALLLTLNNPTEGFASMTKAEQRRKVIDFEDELVEGMNKRPLDSLSQMGEKERQNLRPHLYRRRAGFRDETQQTLNEMRFTP